MNDVAIWGQIVCGVGAAVLLITAGWYVTRKVNNAPDDAGHDGGGFF